MTRCEICGKRMWFWQELIMTTDRFGNVVVPIAHDKCSIGQVYTERSKGGKRNEIKTSRRRI